MEETMMTSMMKKVLLGLVVMAFALPAASFAGSDKEKKRIMTDANGDGKVTMAEHMDAAKQRFERKDLNGDGVLTKDEMKRDKKMKDMKDEKKGKDGKKGRDMDDGEEDDNKK